MISVCALREADISNTLSFLNFTDRVRVPLENRDNRARVPQGGTDETEATIEAYNAETPGVLMQPSSPSFVGYCAAHLSQPGRHLRADVTNQQAADVVNSSKSRAALRRRL